MVEKDVDCGLWCCYWGVVDCDWGFGFEGLGGDVWIGCGDGGFFGGGEWCEF